MALVKTTLTAAIKASDLVWNVVSTATGFPVVGTVAANQPVLVDDEVAFITGVPVAGQLVVRGRGSEGTVADGHDLGASVITSALAADFPALVPGSSTLRSLIDDIDFYGQDGAIAVPTQDTKAFIGKATPAALTLGPPSLASNGIELVITSQTAAAHVITTVALLDTGAAGSPFSLATFPGQPGASIWLIAQNGLWNVANSNGAVAFT